jgi:hypothetical protein
MDHSISTFKRSSFIWPETAMALASTNMTAEGPQRQQLVSQLSQMTGYSRPACRRFIQRMGNNAKSPYRKWPPRDRRRLLELLDKYTVSEAAQQMRCSGRSIYGVLRRLKIGARMRQDVFSKRRLAAVLHVRFYTVDLWIQKGWLKARVIQIGQVKRGVIKPDDFAQFCLEYREVIIGNRLNLERLEFVYKYVFPPDHNHLLSVRESKKERAAFRCSRPEHDDAERALWEPDEQGLSTAICIHGAPEIAVAQKDAAFVTTQGQRHQDQTNGDIWESAYSGLPPANCGITARPNGSREAGP